MSGLVSTAGLGASVKLIGLTKHTKHRHVPSPVSPNFVAPPAQPSLSFNPIALAAAIARTATTWDDAPVVLLDGLQQSALIELDVNQHPIVTPHRRPILTPLELSWPGAA